MRDREFFEKMQQMFIYFEFINPKKSKKRKKSKKTKKEVT